MLETIIDRKDERVFSPDWQGTVITCDIDRTYLATHFSSFKGLAKIPMEFGVDKKDIPGMVRVLRELRRGPNSESRHTPLYFLSASPAQLRKAIEKKMLLDGLEYDGTTFKRWGKLIIQKGPASLKEQLGYKLGALFFARKSLPKGAEEILIGDDLEKDALAFCLYADVLSGRIGGKELASILMRQGVSKEIASDVVALATEIAARVDFKNVLKRIYIRLDKGQAEPFKDFSPNLRACKSALQIVLGLFDDQLISAHAVALVARDLLDRGRRIETLKEQIQDAIYRGLITHERINDLQKELVECDLWGDAWQDSVDPRWQGNGRKQWVPEHYL